MQINSLCFRSLLAASIAMLLDVGLPISQVLAVPVQPVIPTPTVSYDETATVNFTFIESSASQSAARLLAAGPVISGVKVSCSFEGKISEATSDSNGKTSLTFRWYVGIAPEDSEASAILREAKCNYSLTGFISKNDTISLTSGTISRSVSLQRLTPTIPPTIMPTILPTNTPDTFTINGQVTNDRTGNSPISNAEIFITSGGFSKSTRSDSKGGFSFAGLQQEREYTVKATIKGGICSEAKIIEAYGQDFAIADFKCHRTDLSLRGLVLSKNGEALAGVTIQELSMGIQITDSNGAFEFKNLEQGLNFNLIPSKTSEKKFTFSPAGVSGLLLDDEDVTFEATIEEIGKCESKDYVAQKATFVNSANKAGGMGIKCAKRVHLYAKNKKVLSAKVLKPAFKARRVIKALLRNMNFNSLNIPDAILTCKNMSNCTTVNNNLLFNALAADLEKIRKNGVAICKRFKPVSKNTTNKMIAIVNTRSKTASAALDQILRTTDVCF
ncbi:MAG: hypothetical protein GYA55_07920 [SAR324 cluster bacterium]|uniref:Carboxypeptidase regulatory-like domain-containing protein n=1 Tax=SAR324 cluster bacterium TaxID=2024889 RepID=A0A7X9FRP6_9DELT|nr:hypothetical protein [SAR324 cluster bacterium]